MAKLDKFGVVENKTFIYNYYMSERSADEVRQTNEEIHAQRQSGLRALSYAESVGIPVRVVTLGMVNLGGESEPYTEKDIDRMITEECGSLRIHF